MVLTSCARFGSGSDNTSVSGGGFPFSGSKNHDQPFSRGKKNFTFHFFPKLIFGSAKPGNRARTDFHLFLASFSGPFPLYLFPRTFFQVHSKHRSLRGRRREIQSSERINQSDGAISQPDLFFEFLREY